MLIYRNTKVDRKFNLRALIDSSFGYIPQSLQIFNQASTTSVDLKIPLYRGLDKSETGDLRFTSGCRFYC